MNNVKIFAKTVEKTALQQIETLSNGVYSEQQIRIMPDVHAGKDCTIGTTMTITDKVSPNLVGVDIGCGMLTVKVSGLFDLDKLDRTIYRHVPSGFGVHDRCLEYNQAASILSNLRCSVTNEQRHLNSVGTLGGGNHFIEVNHDSSGKHVLVIHTGSRNLGKQVCEYYQKRATYNHSKEAREAIISKLKSEGRHGEIQAALETIQPTKETYLTGQSFEDYLHDMKLVQQYAELNREVIANIIFEHHPEVRPDTLFHTVHNYIDTKGMILRKGAVSAMKNEMLLIPMNMRDGSLSCVGRGNPDWNCSAPHGAGRLLSRSKARKELALSDFEREMDGIKTTSVCYETLDESPMAYKDMEEILDQIKPTAHVIEILKPVYNYKNKT